VELGKEPDCLKGIAKLSRVASDLRGQIAAFVSGSARPPSCFKINIAGGIVLFLIAVRMILWTRPKAGLS
jgi:hypothetical protein